MYVCIYMYVCMYIYIYIYYISPFRHAAHHIIYSISVLNTTSVSWYINHATGATTACSDTAPASLQLSPPPPLSALSLSPCPSGPSLAARALPIDTEECLHRFRV